MCACHVCVCAVCAYICTSACVCVYMCMGVAYEDYGSLLSCYSSFYLITRFSPCYSAEGECVHVGGGGGGGGGGR